MRSHRFLLIALAAVAVVAVSAACTGVGPSSTGAGDPTASAEALAATPDPTRTPSSTPAPTTSLTPSLSASSTPTLLPIPHGDSTPGSPLRAGARYVTTDPFPIRLSFVAPAGWVGNVGGPYAVWTGPAATGNSLSYQLKPAVYADPCHPEQGAVVPSVGPSAAPSVATTAGDLVKTIIGRPGLARTTPTPTTLGGLPATSFDLMLSAPIRDCSNGTYVLWELPLGATNELQPGMSERIWVVDVEGQALVVEADDTSGGTAAQQQIQQVLDSITFEPAG